jgi:hypothetical protein
MMERPPERFQYLDLASSHLLIGYTLARDAAHSRALNHIFNKGHIVIPLLKLAGNNEASKRCDLPILC